MTKVGAHRGFTLLELAVVLAIVGFLVGTLMYTLQSQYEQHTIEQTQRRLEMAREAVLGFAVANGRLPCPASSTSNGNEAPSGGGACASYDGFLPAVALGMQPVDAEGYATDAWNNRIRYAVAQSLDIASCVGSSSTPHFTHKNNLKANGLSCQPGPSDLLLCKSASGAAVGSCGGGANALVNQGSVVAVIWSTGKNYAVAPSAAAASAAGRTDEAENLDGDTLFVSRLATPAGAPGGEYDDMLVWIPAGLFYGRLVNAAILP